MVEDIKLSTAILGVIADTKSYPMRMSPEDIMDSDAIKENFQNISIDAIVFHIKMLEEVGFIEAKFRDIPTFDGTAYLVKIIGLTKKGSDCVKCIRSSFWGKAKQKLRSAGKPETIQLIFSVCEKLIQ